MSRVERLYEHFEPKSYTLKLKPDKHKMLFSGTVIIEGVKKGKPAKRLVLHAKGLKVESVSVIHHEKTGDVPVVIDRVMLHSKYDELRLHSNKQLYSGSKYHIEINFKGKITRPMNGLYPCYYNDGNTQEIMLATQFESHHAREVFPCIDEPEAKAVFNLTLLTKGDDVVLANTELKAQNKEGQYTQSEFEPTPKMSPYLLAFVIGKVKSLEKLTTKGVKVRTFARPELIKYTEFALDVAVKCLELYSDYFDIDYPLSKCDLIALPDFASGAMENWGLITFREQGLIFDPNNTSLNMQQYVVSVVAHELTHQWFGNLVTMRWWNDLWLNESFATLMSYVALDRLFPQWKSWTQFIVDEQLQAFKLDELENTHPINVSINHPDEIRSIFDNISYDKGASVLLMLMHYLGEKDFKQGLRIYLKRHSYANTESKDLWKAWEEASNKQIERFMHDWTTQAGYPLLKATVSESEINLKQERFLINPESDTPKTVWPLPLFTNNKSLQTEIFSKHEAKLKINKAVDATVFNLNRKAFYRVIYDSRHLSKLSNEVKSLKLNELDRLGLLSDHFEAAKAGLEDTVLVLKLLDNYLNEDSVVVWDVISTIISNVRSVMDNDSLRKSMNPEIQRLVKKQYDRLSWVERKDDSHFDKLLRPLILGLACASDFAPALARAKELFQGRTKNSIHPDIRAVVYSTIARHGDHKEFKQLLKMHDSTENSEERLILSMALTDFKQEDIIKQSLDLITSDSVRLQDATYWLAYSFSNRYSKTQAWEWMKSNWSWLKDNLGDDLSFYVLPRYVARAFSDFEFLDDFKSFYEKHGEPSLERTIKQAIETITWQALWKKRDLKSIMEFYKSLTD